ncbi:hypothetical protein [Streptomyces mirabilis]|uniref:hypothetical protein n=1 Tax=Streptomyces mirabilis TaxID=68239 RepID=UPI00368A9397
MTDHRTEAERHLSAASYTNRPGGSPVDPAAAAHHLGMAQAHALIRNGDLQEQMLATAEKVAGVEALDREHRGLIVLLDTLIERWQEVAEAYKPGDGEWDDVTRQYRHYRHIYLRNVRDLRHVLQTGQIPCSLMTDAERATGECGHQHDAELEQHGTPEETAS